MRDLAPSVIACVVGVLVVGGCAAPTTVGRPIAATTTAPTGVALPPRPRDISLNDIDPCTLLTPSQRKALGLDGKPHRYTETAPLFRGPACGISGFEPQVVSMSTALALDNGIGAVTGPDAVGTLTPISVAGFPAVLSRDLNHPEACSVDIDVNAGQFVDAAFGSGGSIAVPQDELCRRAVAVAVAAVGALLSR